MSNVPKSERRDTDMEVYHNAISLRKKIVELLLRDFGVKDKVRTVNVLARIHNISDEDKTTLQDILNKYDMGDTVIEEYPSWLIDKLRTRIFDTINDLILNYRSANSIYPIYEGEYYKRREIQDMAIADCEQLYELFQCVVEILPVDINKYKMYSDSIKEEEKLLKAWRKSDNKILTAIKNKNKKQHESQDDNK